jgi:flagellar hook-associated protein 2
MAGIQANGLGSGLDINSLVTQLVNAEGAPLQQRITRHEVAVTTKVSALGTLKGALAAFKSALEPLKSVSAFQARSATSADTKIFSATADTDAVAGHYDIEVERLASAHQVSSAAFLAGSTATVGYGSLTISLGAASFTVQIDEDAATVADIRDAINAASNNVGVRATLLNTADGTRLVLTSDKTGEDHVIGVSASGGDGGLSQLRYEQAGFVGMTTTQLSEAQNAMIRIASLDVESDTNVFENAIDGVTITALKGSEGEEVSLNVAFDTNSVQARIQKFVTEYNAMQTKLAQLGSYNAETKAAGPLLGDSLLRGIEGEMRRSLSTPVAGLTSDYTTLASIGITTSANGNLQVDSAKLTKALNAEPQAVAELFGSEGGVAARMFEQVERRLQTGGDIESRDTRLKGELKDIQKDKDALTLRMTQVEARYRKQFTALDSLLSQMQSTSSYLAQQLANLPKIGG